MSPSEPASALFVRLHPRQAQLLDAAARELRRAKKDIFGDLIDRYVGPSRDRPAGTIEPVAVAAERAGGALTLGRHAFEPAGAAEVLDAAGAAALLQVDESDVVSLAEAGELPGRRIGGSWRFSRAAVLAWLGHVYAAG